MAEDISHGDSLERIGIEHPIDEVPCGTGYGLSIEGPLLPLLDVVDDLEVVVCEKGWFPAQHKI